MSNEYCEEGFDFQVVEVRAAGSDPFYTICRIRSNYTQEILMASNRYGSWMFTDEGETFCQEVNPGVAAALQRHDRILARDRQKATASGWMD